ncbi:AAA family ATPase [Burkholderia stabilis]|uniref:AAA family ATPase n=1 Tax=Burkholderia stabilis TaxID=95485 RepID=UPI001ABACDF4|nr:AAA family ATPase [Burkholderia stabilis]
MKLQRLHLRNFRCFDDLTLDFGKRLTVIIGDNGAGKTALLDAIAIGFGRYLTKLPEVTGRATSAADIRIDRFERKEPVMMLGWEVKTHDDQEIIWAGGRRRDASVVGPTLKKALSTDHVDLLSKGFKGIDEFTNKILHQNGENEPYFLPVIAYYGTNRAIREEIQRRRGFKKNFSRFDALSDALNPDSHFKAAFEWFNAMEDVERRERISRRNLDYVLPELEIVREAITRLLPEGFSAPRTEIRPLRFVIDKLTKNNTTQTFRISQLSDGYRVVLGLAMDFARRLAQANDENSLKMVGAISPLDVPAIALIDELDLHLHPSWQQRIVTDLMQTFRNTQFIVTTHSPQVLSTVKRENVRVIGVDAKGKMMAGLPLATTYGEPSGDIMQTVMHVDPQPPIPEKGELDKLTELVDQGAYESEEAINLLHQLSRILGENHPQLQRLHRSISRQNLMKK